MITIDQYATLDIQEGKGNYAGTYSLLEGWIGREGDFKVNFCKREFGKEKVEKNVPVGVKLGSPAKIVEVGLWLLKTATGKDYAPVGEMIDDDVPF
jgi:hypothetical protein